MTIACETLGEKRVVSLNAQLNSVNAAATESELLEHMNGGVRGFLAILNVSDTRDQALAALA